MTDFHDLRAADAAPNSLAANALVAAFLNSFKFLNAARIMFSGTIPRSSETLLSPGGFGPASVPSSVTAETNRRRRSEETDALQHAQTAAQLAAANSSLAGIGKRIRLMREEIAVGARPAMPSADILSEVAQLTAALAAF